MITMITMMFRSRSRSRITLGFALGLVAVAAGCDGTARSRDTTAPISLRASEVALRLDLPAGGSPALSVLAFRAQVSGSGTGDVLGAVDPLVAPAPGLNCELRQVDDAARNLRAARG